jgi:hypothetical protein
MMNLTRAATRRVGTVGRSGLVVVVAVLGFAAAPAAFAKTKNVNFVGTWTPNTGVAWTITHENRATGACSGYSALKSSGYGLVGCHVTGRHYRFTITYGSGYRSVNTGTIHGNRLNGRFNDGSVNPYTARRTKR